MPHSNVLNPAGQVTESTVIANIALQPPPLKAASHKILQVAFHDLQVHQIELELQNEELRRVQDELSTAKALYVALYDFSPVGYCTLSERGGILQLNLTLAKLLDQPCGQMVHQMLSCHILNDDQDIYYLHRQRLLETGQPQVCELRLKKADHSVMWVRMEACVVPCAGGELISQVAISDISGSKQAEVTLREWNQMLEHRVAERTLELRQSKERFRHLTQATFEGIAIAAGGMVIDSNDQLCAMFGYPPGKMKGHSIMSFVAPESQSWVRARILEAGEGAYECVAIRKDGTRLPVQVQNRMDIWLGQKAMISAVRDLTEIKWMAVKLKAQQTELEHAQRLALVSEVSTGMIHQIGQPLCAMTPILGDMVQLKQVVLNLVHNAFDACEGGPPERRRVVISTRNLERDRVELSVRDHGHGIAPEVLSRLFVPFFTTKAEGMGMGLRLSQTIVEAHGGSVKGCNSADGIGAIFRVILPIADLSLGSVLQS